MKKPVILTIAVSVCLIAITLFISGEGKPDYLKVGLTNAISDDKRITVQFDGPHYIATSDNPAQALGLIDTAASYTFHYNEQGDLAIKVAGSDPTLQSNYYDHGQLLDNNGDNHSFTIKDSCLMAADNTSLTILGKPYDGGFSVGRNVSAKLIAVNVLMRQDYLKGVVAKEMPASWHIEALKAQTVAARTYSIRQMNRHYSDGFDLCNTTHCQVYGGINGHAHSASMAVEQTDGKIIVYDGFTINAMYHASSGGYIENSEDIYYSPLPYMKAKPDPYSLMNEKNDWSVQLDAAEISRRMANAGYKIGQVQSISVDETLASGRVVALTVNGDQGSVTLAKEKIRAALGYADFKSLLFSMAGGANQINVMSADGLVPLSDSEVQIIGQDGQVSTVSGDTLNVVNADVTYYELARAATSDEGFSFSGKGMGHGLGMSQYGAQAMAQQGFDYRDILGFYYTNTEVITIEELN